jgi:hypothetical protein
MRELKWYDPNDENSPWIKALAEVRHLAPREGWCYQHVRAIIVAIDRCAEAALGNRDFFLNRPYGIAGKRKDNGPKSSERNRPQQSRWTLVVFIRARAVLPDGSPCRCFGANCQQSLRTTPESSTLPRLGSRRPLCDGEA